MVIISPEAFCNLIFEIPAATASTVILASVVPDAPSSIAFPLSTALIVTRPAGRLLVLPEG